ncbi:MAG: DUF262 domain-containing protein [Verrucomicrobiia bacterium]|jgi:hypothetical protein
MANESIKMRELVDRAVSHTWSIPEFQRGFVWKPVQVRDLIESLWLDYPIGSLLVWNSQQPTQERVVSDAQRPALWVVDGQQRTAALCILFGRKPYWWSSAEEWEKVLRKYDIRFDVDAKEPPFFWVANAAIRKVKELRYIPVSKLLVLDTQKDKDQATLQTLAKEIKLQGLCDGMDAMEVYTRLDRVRKIRDRDLVTITIDHELEDVVEIFARLNSRGTRVTEADIYLGVVAARAPGWVRSTFLPYLGTLGDAGFRVSPNLLFRTLTGVGVKKVRFKEIADDFWNPTSILPHWQRTTKSWGNLVSKFREYGVLSNDPMPTEAALVTMVALVDRFPGDPFEPAMYWFLQASRFARYSGSSATSLEEDLRDLQDSSSLLLAVQKLVRRFTYTTTLEAEDFLRDYGDARFGRFLLYLLVYRNKAKDWDEKGNRIGFEGVDLLADFRPQWHHVFPKKFLEGKVNADKIDALANIAVIGPTINIRISAKDPMDYIKRYKIGQEKLVQQFIGEDITQVSIDNYEKWLNDRAKVLADAANIFLSSLGKEVLR